jgi:hypothetical protein
MGKIVVLLFGCTLAEAFLSTNVLKLAKAIASGHEHPTVQLLKTSFFPSIRVKFKLEP